MPTPPPIEHPKCYASECGRRNDGTCARSTCPVLPGTPANPAPSARAATRCPCSFPHPPHDYCDGNPEGREGGGA